MVAICPSRARPSPNDVRRTSGRWRMIGSTESVVISSLLGRRSRLVSFFRRRPQPRHRRKNRVLGQRQEKLAGESLLAGAGERGLGSPIPQPQAAVSSLWYSPGQRNALLLAIREARSLCAIDDFVTAVTAAAAVARQC